MRYINAREIQNCAQRTVTLATANLSGLRGCVQLIAVSCTMDAATGTAPVYDDYDGGKEAGYGDRDEYGTLARSIVLCSCVQPAVPCAAAAVVRGLCVLRWQSKCTRVACSQVMR